MFSCKSRKGLPIKPKEDLKPIVDNRPALQLVKKQKENELKFDWFATKSDIVAEVNGDKQNLSAVIRIKHDSLIWISINALLGIEVARVLITPDSLKLLNRINSTYLLGDVKQLSSLLNADFDFYMLQSLLLGNSFDYYEDERLKTSIENDVYIISSLKKRNLHKAEINSDPQRDEPLQSLYIDPKTFKLLRTGLIEYNPKRTMDISYSNFSVIDSLQTIPIQIDVDIKAQKTITVKLNYEKFKINQVQEVPFKIPAKYTNMLNK